MTKILCESLKEFMSSNDRIDEGSLTVRSAVDDAIKHPEDVKRIDNAIKGAFRTTEAIKSWLLKQTPEKKLEILKAGAEKLLDKRMSYLKYVKNQEGKWVVGAVPAQGLNPASPK
jgi:Fe-S cluster biosynthesis and repair protein YggX